MKNRIRAALLSLALALGAGVAAAPPAHAYGYEQYGQVPYGGCVFGQGMVLSTWFDNVTLEKIYRFKMQYTDDPYYTRPYSLRLSRANEGTFSAAGTASWSNVENIGYVSYSSGTLYDGKFKLQANHRMDRVKFEMKFKYKIGNYYYISDWCTAILGDSPWF